MNPESSPSAMGTAGPPDAALHVVRFNGADAEWDAFIERAEGSTFAHRAGWRGVMTDVLRHECIYLIAMDNTGTWRGVLPLVRVRSMLGHYIVSMPFLNDGGPLGDAAARAQLVAYAVDEARRSGASLLELRSRTPMEGTLPSTYRKVTAHLPLPESVELLWAETFRAKLRSQIRRPTKEGMVARSGPGELVAFYDVFARNMRDLGTPVLPRALFEHIANTFGDSVLFTAVYTRDGVPAATGCSLIWRDEVEIVWASSLREYNRLSPNMLLYARTMEESIARGAHLFNFGRCTPGGATHKFKLQWGGSDVPLPWPTWSRDDSAGTPSPDRPHFRLATRVWSKLPMAITNRLGPALSRHLP